VEKWWQIIAREICLEVTTKCRNSELFQRFVLAYYKIKKDIIFADNGNTFSKLLTKSKQEGVEK